MAHRAVCKSAPSARHYGCNPEPFSASSRGLETALWEVILFSSNP